ncbi:MAG: chorismate synthase [Phycisphaerae bacterium]|nr:chorismate synthase [Phycisphaerae bacterium]
MTYRTAGESHGPALISLVEGLPAGLAIDVGFIDGELRRRQGGYGRGGRQRIESDAVTFLSGVRLGKTIGSPIAMQIPNRDSRLDDLERTPPVHRPRPGHADLAGSVKWLTTDCRETLERASARETAARVAAGAVARCLLREVGIECFGFVRAVLDVRCATDVTASSWHALREARDASEVYCPDSAASAAMIERIHRIKTEHDTAGGLVECHVFGCPIGLGSCMTWDGRLDGRIGGAVMGIQAFKSVEIGLGRESAFRPGSQVHDPISFDPSRRGERDLGFTRSSNNAGGLEGGMTNGMPVVVTGAMKPIATLGKGMPSVDLNTKEATGSQYERSDVSAIAAASVVLENVVAFEIARALLEKFPADTMIELRASLDSFLTLAGNLPLDGR